MKQSDYSRLKAEIERKYSESIAALNLLWGHFGEVSANADHSGPGLGAITHAVREAIASQAGQFSIKHLERWLSLNKPTLVVKQATIRMILRRLTGKEIEVVEKGQGRAVSIYKRKLTIVDTGEIDAADIPF